MYIGEYPLTHDASPRLLRSPDGGASWDSVSIPGVRHIHGVHADPYTNDIWITTGDRDQECRILRLRDNELEVVGGGSQEWRAVELAFTPSAILWGVDCSYLPRRNIYRLNRSDIRNEAPTPVHSVDGSVYYTATITHNDHTILAMSTAEEPTRDSTAPKTPPHRAAGASVVISTSESAFTEWTELLRLEKRPVVADYLPEGSLPNANAYMFICAGERELLVNPFNTDRLDGHILRINASTILDAF